MGEEEQDALVGRAVRESQDAARELAYIRVKAGQAARYLQQMSERLQQVADSEAASDPGFNDYPSPEELAAIFKSYREARGRVSRADDNLKRLGVRNITFID